MHKPTHQLPLAFGQFFVTIRIEFHACNELPTWFTTNCSLEELE